MTRDIDTPPLEEPLAALERELIGAYLAGAGQDLHTLLARDNDEARTMLAAAARYASGKLTPLSRLVVQATQGSGIAPRSRHHREVDG